MLKLAEIIREGLKAKTARPKKTIENTSSVETSQNKIATPPPKIKIGEEPILSSPVLKTTAEGKEKVEARLIGEEIEKAEIKVDEAAHIYKIGNIASLNFKPMEKCSTIMATGKVKEAIKEAFLKKYELTADELNKEIDKHDEKIKSLATRCYIHVLRQRIR